MPQKGLLMTDKKGSPRPSKNDPSNNDPFKTVWDFFASVKLSVVLLSSLAVTSIVGTLIPQNASPSEYLQAFGEVLYRVFFILDMFDMYHSWWFQFLLIMLTANIVVCSLERLSATWKIIFVKKPIVNVSQLRRLPGREQFLSNALPEQVEKDYFGCIQKMFRYSRIEPTDSGYGIYGERGRWTRLGVYAVHLSVLILLTGGLVGSISGFDGFVNIPEGETVNRIQLRNINRTKELDFSIRCDDFDVQFYKSGTPKEFRSRLTILENGQTVLEKEIIVNDPLRYKGINFFQSSYGTMSAKGATLKFTSEASKMVYNIAATREEPVKLPEGGGEFVLKEFHNAFRFGGRNIGEVLVGVLTPNNGTPKEVVLPLQIRGFEGMPVGDWIVSATDPQYLYYTGLQVTKDPSVWIVYTGFIILIIGCYITFFMSHQRIFVEVVRDGSQSRVLVSGTANKNRLGMRNKVKTITEKLKGRHQ